jgi:hypothetical protein
LASTSSLAAASAFSISRSSAFSFSGRDTVMMARWPSISTRTVPLAMEGALQNAGAFTGSDSPIGSSENNLASMTLRSLATIKREFGLVEDMLLQIDARRDLGENDAIGG